MIQITATSQSHSTEESVKEYRAYQHFTLLISKFRVIRSVTKAKSQHKVIALNDLLMCDHYDSAVISFKRKSHTDVS